MPNAYDRAAAEIAAGRATAHALWVLLDEPNGRDGYALRPDPWEGPGEYQHVSFGDPKALGVLVRVPSESRPLPTDWPSRTPTPRRSSPALAEPQAGALRELLASAGVINVLEGIADALREGARTTAYGERSRQARTRAAALVAQAANVVRDD